MKRIDLLIIVFIVVFSIGVSGFDFGGGGGMDLCGISTCGDGLCHCGETVASCVDDCGVPAEIDWGVGILGRCPSGSGYEPCCFDGDTCGLMIGAICTPDADYNSDPSYTHVVQYYNHNSLNNGECATTGPDFVSDPDSCASGTGYGGDIVNCYEQGADNEAYCTAQRLIDSFTSKKGGLGIWTKNALDDHGDINPGCSQAPMSDECKSFRLSRGSGICWGQEDDFCDCSSAGLCFANPVPFCPSGVTCSDIGGDCSQCKASYECINYDLNICDMNLCSPEETEIVTPVTATAATCADGYRNTHHGSAETGVDLGGGCCSDGIKNSGETDLDCGGASCRTTKKCANGKICVIDGDCTNNYCVGGLCEDPAAHCTNAITDFDETDLNCGGSCPSCANGLQCSIADDCESLNCVGGVCIAATCDDGILNQDETETDCGGTVCGPCIPPCTVDAATWSDLGSIDLTEIAEDLYVYTLLKSDDCDDREVIFTVNVNGAPVVYPATYFFKEDPSAVSSYALLELNTAGSAGQTWDFTAAVANSGQADSQSADLNVISVCYIPNPADGPDVCEESPLHDTNPGDASLVYGAQGYPDVDCDGIPDCIDFQIGGVEEVNYYTDADKCTAAAWNCENAPWSECMDVPGKGYGQYRFVRDCNDVTSGPCCTKDGGVATGYKACPPPSGYKECIQEEKFPVFTWVNLLSVVVLISGFYFVRRRKL